MVSELSGSTLGLGGLDACYHSTKCIWLCMHNRSKMHHSGHYVVSVILMLLVCYDVDMLFEIEQEK